MNTKERPILFSGEMVKAILEGRKTQTRRVVKPVQTTPRVPPLHMESCLIDGEQELDDEHRPLWVGTHPDYPTKAGKYFSCPYGKDGDRLWVRETFVIESNFNIDNEKAYPPPFSDGRPICWEEDQEYGRWWRQCHYRATDPDPELYEEDCGHDHDGPCTHWSPSIHMPRWASRITLEITSIRAERLQTITCHDAIAEGVTYRTVCELEKHALPVDFILTFARLWNSINSKRGYPWIGNPWVWVIEFHQVKA